MRWMFLLLVIATNVEAACEKIFVEGGAQTTTWRTVCDSDVERLGTNIGWARMCNYSGDLGKRLRNVHEELKTELNSDADTKKKYQSAVLKMMTYDFVNGCSRPKVEQVIIDAETMLNDYKRAPAKQPARVESSVNASLPNSGNGELLTIENSTALVQIDEKIKQLIVKSDGDEYQSVWDAVASKYSIDVGILVSDKKIEPKRFEFSWSPLRDGFATKIDGVATILVNDDQIFDEIIGAYNSSGKYIYLGAKFNDTMRFRWWRLTRASR